MTGKSPISAIHNLARSYYMGEGVGKDGGRAAELIVMAIKKQDDFTLKQAPFSEWNALSRKALRSAVLALAAKSKGSG